MRIACKAGMFRTAGCGGLGHGAGRSPVHGHQLRGDRLRAGRTGDNAGIARETGPGGFAMQRAGPLPVVRKPLLPARRFHLKIPA